VIAAPKASDPLKTFDSSNLSSKKEQLEIL
jgi:hypothetical protein